MNRCPTGPGPHVKNLDAPAISGLPAARTDQISRVSDHQAVSSSNEAVSWQLYRDHGHAPSPQSQSAFWIYEAANPAKMCVLLINV